MKYSDVKNLREKREGLGISKLCLAQMSGVSRFRITNHELYGSELTEEEQEAINHVLSAELRRVAAIASRFRSELVAV